MLRAGRMEEFVTEEEEPWYDQRDLEQGEPTPPNPTPFLLATAGPRVFMHLEVGGKPAGGCTS